VVGVNGELSETRGRRIVSENLCLKPMEVEERATVEGKKPVDGGAARDYDQD
jgi:hypothetical protein